MHNNEILANINTYIVKLISVTIFNENILIHN